MSGLEIRDGRLEITYGDRTVATTGGTLLQFLTNEQVFTTNITFPDANKTQLYAFAGSVQRAINANFFAIRRAQSVVGARPQEWTDTVVLGEAPEGADLFVGRATLTRTKAPSHKWLNNNISPVIPQGVAIQLHGSMLIELAPGLSRALTIDVVEGDLVATLQHSVGPAAGNFRAHGEIPMKSPSSSQSGENINRGQENRTASVAALPVLGTNNVKDEGRAFESQFGFDDGGAAAWVNAARYGGSAAVGYSDPTDYSSRYSLTVRGRFGRRS